MTTNERTTTMPWDEHDPTPPPNPEPLRTREVVDLDALDDGRCKATSWSPAGRPPKKPTYENHFGPGGYNRCVGSAGHANPTHKDEWGNVFLREGQRFRLVRREVAGA